MARRAPSTCADAGHRGIRALERSRVPAADRLALRRARAAADHRSCTLDRLADRRGVRHSGAWRRSRRLCLDGHAGDEAARHGDGQRIGRRDRRRAPRAGDGGGRAGAPVDGLPGIDRTLRRMGRIRNLPRIQCGRLARPWLVRWLLRRIQRPARDQELPVGIAGVATARSGDAPLLPARCRNARGRAGRGSRLRVAGCPLGAPVLPWPAQFFQRLPRNRAVLGNARRRGRAGWLPGPDRSVRGARIIGCAVGRTKDIGDALSLARRVCVPDDIFARGLPGRADLRWTPGVPVAHQGEHPLFPFRGAGDAERLRVDRRDVRPVLLGLSRRGLSVAAGSAWRVGTDAAVRRHRAPHSRTRLRRGVGTGRACRRSRKRHRHDSVQRHLRQFRLGLRLLFTAPFPRAASEQDAVDDRRPRRLRLADHRCRRRRPGLGWRVGTARQCHRAIGPHRVDTMERA